MLQKSGVQTSGGTAWVQTKIPQERQKTYLAVLQSSRYDPPALFLPRVFDFFEDTG